MKKQLNIDSDLCYVQDLDFGPDHWSTVFVVVLFLERYAFFELSCLLFEIFLEHGSIAFLI